MRTRLQAASHAWNLRTISRQEVPDENLDPKALESQRKAVFALAANFVTAGRQVSKYHAPGPAFFLHFPPFHLPIKTCTVFCFGTELFFDFLFWGGPRLEGERPRHA